MQFEFECIIEEGKIFQIHFTIMERAEALCYLLVTMRTLGFSSNSSSAYLEDSIS